MHQTPIRVRFDEVDSMGVVHHPRYVVYFEVARTAYLAQEGWPYSELMDAGVHLAVIDVGVRYLRPARYEDELVVGTRVTDVSGTRMRLEYEVRREDELLATGHTRLASIRPDGRPLRMPVELRQGLAALIEEDAHG